MPNQLRLTNASDYSGNLLAEKVLQESSYL
jgi:hypothetical protein